MGPIIVEPASVTAFLERMLEDGGMKDIEPGVRQQMMDDLRTRLSNALFGVVLSTLPEAELPALDALVERQASQVELQAFLRERIKNLDEVLAQGMLDFRNRYVKG